MTSPDDLDRSNMERLVGGHDAALNALMQRHSERLFHYLIRQLGNEQDAEDLAQETFVRVYQNRARFDPSHKFSTWLYTIATNLAKDRLKWRARHPQVSLDAQEPETGAQLSDRLPDKEADPGAKLEQHELGEVVRHAIAALPDELRTPLILAEYEQLSQAEIGEVLGCTSKAVETRIYRARKQMRAALEKTVNC